MKHSSFFLLSLFAFTISTFALPTISEDIPLVSRSTCNKLDKIFQKLSNLNDIDITGVFTVIEEIQQEICDKFQDTWTILDGLSTPTQCIILGDFSTVFTALDCLEETLDTKFQETWTILGKTCQNAIALSQPITISDAGLYCLSQDIAGSIIIDADDVQLDLNTKQVSGGSPNSIAVTSHSNVTIKNGSVASSSVAGIALTTCTSIMLENIDFVANATGLTILTCTLVNLSNCTFRANTDQAINLDDVHASCFQNCACFLNTGATHLMFIENSDSLKFANLELCNNNGASVFTPLFLQNVSSCEFKNNIIDQNSATTALQTIFIGPNSSSILLKNSTVSNNSSTTLVGLGIFNTVKNIVCKNLIIAKNSSTSNSTLVQLSGLQNATFDTLGIFKNTSTNRLKSLELDTCESICFDKLFAEDNTGTATFIGIDCASSQNVLFNDTSLSGNSALSWLHRGFNIHESNGIFINSSHVAANTGPENDGITLENTTNLNCNNTAILSNNGSQVIGINIITSCTDLVFKDCVSLNHTATNGSAKGFCANDSQKIFIDTCFANDNTATTTAVGFDFFNTGTSSILNSLAKVNQGISADGIGIQTTNCFDITCKNNQATANVGSISAYGIAALNCLVSNFLANTCNSNGTSGIRLANSSRSIILENICNSNTAVGIDLVNSSSNCIKSNIVSCNTTGVQVDSTSMNNGVVNNTALVNTDTGFNNLGTGNYFVLNKSEHNGTDGTNNFNGVSTSIITIFDVELATFVSGTNNQFVNVDIRP